MVVSIKEQVPPELVDQWSKYLDPSQRDQFRTSCVKANTQNIEDTLRPFFATWKTTLMHSSLESLKAVASDNRLRPLINTIIIQDDCASLDPYTGSEIPSDSSLYDIWPRNDTGTLETDKIGIVDLVTLLREGQLRPSTIQIRDYGMAEQNLDFCPETRQLRDKYKDIASGGKGSAAIAALVREIIEGSDAAATSIVIEYTFLHEGENSFYRSPRFAENPTWTSVSSPSTYDACITLSPEHQGRNVGFSMLRSGEFRLGQEATPYWLEQIFYQATSLESLTLQLQEPRASPIAAARVVPQLKEFVLKHTTTSSDKILTMLAASGGSLEKLVLYQITLEKGSSWRELLLALSRSCPALGSFRLSILREQPSNTLPIDFRDLQEDSLPEVCRSGLAMTVKRNASGDRRVSRIDYSGSEAGKVLAVAARDLIDGIPIR